MSECSEESKEGAAHSSAPLGWSPHGMHSEPPQAWQRHSTEAQQGAARTTNVVCHMHEHAM